MKPSRRPAGVPGPSSPRLGAYFLFGGGVLAAFSALLPGPPDINRPALAAVGGGAALLGVVAWFLPWERWPWWSNLTLLPVTFALLSLGNVFNGYAPYSYGSYYVVIFVWLGMAHRPWMSVIVSPLMVLSYLLPLIVLPGDFATEASSLMLVLPTCVMVGEILARVRLRLHRTEERLRAYSLELEVANRATVAQDRRLRSAMEELQRVEAERRSLLDRTVNALEEERKRIALDLHDGPIQHLTALDFGLEAIRKRLESGDGQAAYESLAKAQEIARDDVTALRNLMSGLRPPALDEYGLETALRDHVESVSAESGVECAIDVDLPRRLDPTLETVLYRVAQEALMNVVKHAHAGRASVAVRMEGDAIALDVLDDGVGFRADPGQGNGVRGHYGLMAMRQRVEMVGGSWEILPNPAGGTWVRAVVPAPARVARAAP